MPEMSANTVNQQIRDFVHGRFPLASSSNLDDQTSLLEGGIIDSLGILDLVSYLETEFSIQIDDEDFDPNNFQNVDQIAKFVAGKK